MHAKLLSLRARKALNHGQLVAHHTSTLPGIAAHPHLPAGIRKAQFFKQRHKPFLLLADSPRTALRQAIWLPANLRKLAKTSWPGAMTLVFTAKKTLPAACYEKRSIAVRVDADTTSRRLAKHCGGLLLSSSLNRQGKPTRNPSTALKFRWHRHISAVLTAKVEANGKASHIFKVVGHQLLQLR